MSENMDKELDEAIKNGHPCAVVHFDKKEIPYYSTPDIKIVINSDVKSILLYLLSKIKKWER